MADKKTKADSSVWATLSRINVNDHTEKKGNLTYLSWAWAWQTVKDNYPNASFEKHWFRAELTDSNDIVNGPALPYAIDGKGNAYVMVTVRIEDETVTETYPVLTHNNRAAQNPDSFQVNTSLQRCLTKALSYCGLGFYIYAGEDLPAGENVNETFDKPVLLTKFEADIDTAKNLNELQTVYDKHQSDLKSLHNRPEFGGFLTQAITKYSNKKKTFEEYSDE